MDQLLIVVAVVVAMLGVMAVWVWVLGRIESRQLRRDVELSSGPDGERPRHMRRRGRVGRRAR